MVYLTTEKQTCKQKQRYNTYSS